MTGLTGAATGFMAPAAALIGAAAAEGATRIVAPRTLVTSVTTAFD
jgi:hypothetical protein